MTEDYWLTDQLKAFASDGSVGLCGTDQKDLKKVSVIQYYKSNGGGYIAAYPRDEEKAIYPVGGGFTSWD